MSGRGQRYAKPYVLESGADRKRLERICAEHPDMLIGGGEFGTWQAVIPEKNGETFIVRYTLRELLDRLTMLLEGQ